MHNNNTAVSVSAAGNRSNTNNNNNNNNTNNTNTNTNMNTNTPTCAPSHHNLALVRNATPDYERSMSEIDGDVMMSGYKKQEITRRRLSQEARTLAQTSEGHANNTKTKIVESQRHHSLHTMERLRHRQHHDRDMSPQHLYNDDMDDINMVDDDDNNDDDVKRKITYGRNGTSTWMTLKPTISELSVSNDTSRDSDGLIQLKKPSRHESHKENLLWYNQEDSPCHHKVMFYWVTGCAFIDVFIWLSFVIVFTTYVQYTILSAPIAENALNNQMRQFIGGTEALAGIQDEQAMFMWLRDTLVPALAPERSTSSIRQFAKYPNRNKNKSKSKSKSNKNQTLQSINGKLIVLENEILIRQTQCKFGCDGYNYGDRWSRDTIANFQESENIDTFDLLREPHNGTTIQGECRTKNLQSNPTSKYFSQEETSNTNTTAEVRGLTMVVGGGGYIERINLGLHLDLGAEQDKTSTTVEKVLHVDQVSDRDIDIDKYDAAMALTRRCAQEKVSTLEKSGWITERTRSVFIEFCVVPWYTYDWSSNNGAAPAAAAPVKQMIMERKGNRTAAASVYTERQQERRLRWIVSAVSLLLVFGKHHVYI